jgi:protein involved in polysaccharide export with SLBB domain
MTTDKQGKLMALQIVFTGSLLWGFLVFISLSFVGTSIQLFGQTATPTPAGPDTTENSLIHYGDLIDVDVVGSLDGDWRGTLSPEGFIQGLLFAPDPIYGLCKSEEAIAAEIAAQYSKNLRDPKIVVRVLDRSGRAATLLLGAVRNQQRFKLKREVRLSEVLALSGGITDIASGEITIARPSNLNCFSNEAGDAGKLTIMKLSIAKLLEGDPKSDPIVLSGDIITVVQASPIYVIGGVNAPRLISSREELTVSRAVASAGGLAKEAVESDVTIYRRDGRDSKTISVDLKRIRTKQQDDLVLKPFDIVDVGQKGRAKPKFAPNVNADIVSRDIYKLPVRIVE